MSANRVWFVLCPEESEDGDRDLSQHDSLEEAVQFAQAVTVPGLPKPEVYEAVKVTVQ